MRSVGRELLLCFKGMFKAVKHTVECRCEVIEFPVDSGDFDPPVQVLSLCDFRNSLFNPPDRVQGLSGNHPAADDAGKQKDRNKKHCRSDNIVQLHFLRGKCHHAADPQISQPLSGKLTVVNIPVAVRSGLVFVNARGNKGFILHLPGNRILAIEHRTIRRIQSALHIIDLIKKIVVDLQPAASVPDPHIVCILRTFFVISIVELDLICIFIDRTQQVAPDGFLKYGSADKTEHMEGQKFQSDQDKGRPQGNTQSDGSRSVFLHIMHPFSVFNS